MLLFRSEAHLNRWRQAQQMPRGETLSLAQIWALAKAWYGDRLQPDFTGRTIAEAHHIFSQLGLTAPFWYLQSDS